MKKNQKLLIDMHVNDKKSVVDIACCANISPKKVKENISGFGIKVKNGSSAEYIGKKFGHIVVEKISNTQKNKKVYFICSCDCGTKNHLVSQNNIYSGEVRSCGCINKLSGSQNFNWKGCGEIGLWSYHKTKISAESRNLEFDISIEFLWDLYLEQNRKCAISGVDIIFSSNPKTKPQTASLDRIDSSVGYTEDNVQWTHKKINIMKQSMSDREFIEWCSIITAHNEKR